MLSKRSISAYLAPIVVFGLLGALESFLPSSLYPLTYSIKIAAVVVTLLQVAPLDEIRPTTWSVVGPSVVVGLLVFVLWVGIDSAVPYPHMGGRIGFNPLELTSGVGRAVFLAIRLFGLVLVVPVMEELCWRSFVLRYATNDDFLSVPIGTFSLGAYGAMVAFSAAAHPEWLVAAIASAIYGLWVRHTKSLFAVVVAHAVTNAALGVYVLTTHDWKYW